MVARFLQSGGRLRMGMLVAMVLSASAATLKAADASGPDAERASARAILEATGVQGGLVVHLGCGDGKLTAALGARDAYVVHGLDADAANVERARGNIRSVGLYGRVSVGRLRGARLPYADNLVTLVVADRPRALPMAEVMRVLAPGGVAYLRRARRWRPTHRRAPSRPERRRRPW